MANPFSQATGGFGQQQRPAFGQASPFGQSTGFGTPPPAYGSGGFGSTPSGFATSGFGTSGMNQPSSGFGTSGMNQPSSGFGTSGMNQPSGGFGTSGMNQPSGGFGTSINQTSSGFGTSINQTSSGFGTSGMNQASGGFGISGTNQASSGFGTSQTGSGGFKTTTSTPGFGPQGSMFGGTGFGTMGPQSASGFGASTTPSFGSGGFGTQSHSGSGLFGNTSTLGGSAVGNQSNTSNAFGGSTFGTATQASRTSTQPKSFGGPTFGTVSQASAIGTPSLGPTTQTGMFGIPSHATVSQTTSFGSPSYETTTWTNTIGPTTKTSTLGSSFATATSTRAQNSFGGFGSATSSGATTFGGSGLGTSQAPTVFGQTTQSSVFGGTGLQTGSSTFGGGTLPVTTSAGSFNTQTTASIGIFGQTGPQSVLSGTTGMLSSGISGQRGIQSTQGPYPFSAAPSVSTGLFGLSGTAGKSEIGGDVKKSDNTKNLFGKPELKMTAPITELSPPSTVLCPVSTAGTAFPSSNKASDSVFGRVQSRASTSGHGMFGKSDVTDKDEKLKVSSKKMLFGKLVAGSGVRRRSMDQPGTSFDTDDQTTKRKPSKENDEEPQSKRPIRRLSSADQMSSRVAIVCNYVPNKYNNVFSMKRHFSKFGDVAKVFPNPRKFMTTIHFKTHEAARDAKARGKFLDKGVRPMEIFWSSYRRRSTDESDSTPIKRKSDHEFAGIKPTTKSAKFQWAKNDLDDELAGMSGTSDIASQQINVLDRPDDVGKSSLPGSPVRNSSPGPSSSRNAVTIPTNVDKGSMAVLRNTVCHTAADKLQILNLRDKIIRLGMKKTANLKSKAFVGTCTDMCPEREHYDREVKRRLHLFESMNPGSSNPQVDHSRAVKEYSRSSADQEEPLPHELRPLPALILTMNYLLTEIADRGEDGKWEGWFDFLWDRTRGIRKDITQQQLTTPESAELLEKCVRFHIFCSERLCEEDMHTFDLKINNENMTKCLQTLKEFYHDLDKKQNLFCRNEAEIRSYMVLMNLNEGDILRETQQLRPAVRNTQYINFAVQVHSSLNSNNFVRFFKLVKKASFLQACIMHRYFTQVRSRALLTLIKAYRPKSHYSLNEMVRCLGFESKIEARYFCKFHGLNVTEEFVVLDRTSYVEPEESWLPRRSQNIIESKLSSRIGEVMNGEPLLPLSLPTPINSFDDNLRFVGKLDVNVSDISEIQTKPVVQDKPSVPQPEVIQEVKPEIKPDSGPQKLQYTNDDVKDLAKHLFWEVIGDMAKEVSEDLIQGALMISNGTQDVCDIIVEEVVTEYVGSLSQSYHTEVTLLKQKKDKETMIQSSAVHFTSVIIKDVVDQEVLNLATAEIREVKAQLKREQIDRGAIEISDELVDLVMNEMCEELAEEVYQKDVVERLEELDDICHCIELERAGRFLQRWKKEYLARIKLKRSMLDFPPAVAMDNSYDTVQKLIPERQNDVCDNNGFYVNKLAKLKIDTPERDLTNRWAVDLMLSAHELYRKICHLKSWQPLDIATTAGSQLQKHFKICKSRTFYWKLILSLPDLRLCGGHEEKDVGGLLEKWLRSKFTKGKDETSSDKDKDMLSLYRTEIQYSHSSIVKDLGVCIKAVKDEELGHSDLLGTNGIIFVLPPGVTDDLSAEYWDDARSRLQTLLQLKPLYPPVPLVIMIPLLISDDLDDLVYTGLDLPSFTDEEFVSTIYLRPVDLQDYGRSLDVTQPELNQELQECVQFLAEAYPPQPDIKVRYLKDFIDDYILKKFFSPVLQNLKQRKQNGFLHQMPEQMVILFNHVISHMTKVLASETLKDQSWPVAEFFSTKSPTLCIPASHWNTEDHLYCIEQLTESLQLPWFLNDDFEKDDWSEICEVLWIYIDKVIDDHSGQAKIDLSSKIRLILKNTERDFEDLCYLLEKETRCEPSHENIPWTDVISACIDYKLTVTQFNDTQLNDKFELLAVYMKKELDDYRPPDSWRFMESVKDFNVTTSMKSSMQIAKIKSKAKKAEESLSYEPDHVNKTQNNANIVLEIEPECVQAARKISISLTSDLKKEQRESNKYDEFLKNALLKGDLNNTTMPDISALPPWSVFDSPDKTVSGDHVLLESLSEPLITDEVDKLKKEIDTNRRASDLFESRLKQWLGSPV
ncbi:germinal-center associated nuclear protein-like isoform X3 [Mytilus galloprovincialis]|uniref:germinal-center associated nuclear protein-like isoform X3 n=1 Tax=Mytilus galloprovincialis TaxID=29158 RepID=UPI003F7C5EF7